MSRIGPVLLADIGGTNARFTVVSGDRPAADRGPPSVLSFRGDDHESFEDLVGAVREGLRGRPAPVAAVFAVACPPEPEEIRFTNRDWKFSKTDLKATLGVETLRIVNDFAALAHALPHLDETAAPAIGDGRSNPDAPMVVLGPGTGLGMAALLPAGDRWSALPGEGGHVTLAARTEIEDEILTILRRRHDHVSAERALSGPGLSALHDAVRARAGMPERALTPADVVEAAQAGEPHARTAVGLFADFLGTVASDAALTFGARGGVFLGGGVLPRMGEVFAAARFRKRFESKGRFSGYCAAIPTRLVIHPHAALTGLAAALPDLLGEH